jgi:hypothetical protein
MLKFAGGSVDAFVSYRCILALHYQGHHTVGFRRGEGMQHQTPSGLQRLERRLIPIPTHSAEQVHGFGETHPGRQQGASKQTLGWATQVAWYESSASSSPT